MGSPDGYVILGYEKKPLLGYTFKDGSESANVEEDALLDVLCQGEKKALYILNILFEVEVMKKVGQETLLVIDDIADSFDYRNKYAIIQYLRDMAKDKKFKL